MDPINHSFTLVLQSTTDTLIHAWVYMHLGFQKGLVSRKKNLSTFIQSSLQVFRDDIGKESSEQEKKGWKWHYNLKFDMW